MALARANAVRMAEQSTASTPSQARKAHDIIRYQEVLMPDLLIRNVPSEDVAALDDQARSAGLSRSDFLRRQLHQQAQRTVTPVTRADFIKLDQLIVDLDEADVMEDAWS